MNRVETEAGSKDIAECAMARQENILPVQDVTDF